jgi:hypothetical protein
MILKFGFEFGNKELELMGRKYMLWNILIFSSKPTLHAAMSYSLCYIRIPPAAHSPSAHYIEFMISEY